MRLLQFVPNTLTSLNLFFGATGIMLAFQGRPDLTAWCILIAAFFDFTDGFAARMLKAYSDIGKELDSLADLISFGLAPAVAFMSLLHFGLTGSWRLSFFIHSFSIQVLLLFPFVLAVFSALRLAKFNIDTRQTESFLGLTTTATGMFSVSLIHLIYTRGEGWEMMASPWFVLPVIVVFCALLVSEIPMFSLKFKDFHFQRNFSRYLLIMIGGVSLVFFGVGGIAFTVLGYLIFSLVSWLRKA